ncbi:hypothetical protein FNW02_33150 [Komarekiella sp. 'clone 1']|uniref:Uncharacterized protein n=1 Tax=Komarekiella delphini-convector SJRDD-AB1 TaxID=2593771 RepID=A0AA40T3Y3_9NOST|nr:hypothetical protein [Komarekiella delphini-convector]MBD6620501.1 hypothetical protein [Komarekiella delphini-convector SJRDD-AB1]
MATQLDTPFPKELRTPENSAKIRIIIKQWTQLIAWTWTNFLAFEQDETNKEQEKVLKEYFSSILKKQALFRLAAIEYGDPQSAQSAEETSKIIKEVITSNKTAPGISLTLADVYKQLTTNDYIFTDPLVQDFRFEVTVDSFTGNISYEYDEERKEKYVAIIAYPPRPALSEFTVTEDQLKDWMQDNLSGNYLPPSVYIPVSGS